METQTMTPEQVRTFVEAYLQAFNARDLARCLDFYTEDATLTVLNGVYRGHAAIAGWLEQRFAADAQLVRIDAVRVNGDTVIADGAVTSRRLKAMRVGNLTGRATIRLAGGKVKEMKLGLRLGDIFQEW